MISAQLQSMLSIPTVREWSVGESNSGPNNSIIKTLLHAFSKFLSSISSFVHFHKTRKQGSTSELNDLILIAIFVRLLFQRPIKVLTARAMLIYNRTKNNGTPEGLSSHTIFYFIVISCFVKFKDSTLLHDFYNRHHLSKP